MNLTDRYLWDAAAGRKLADFSTTGKKDNVDREEIYKKEQKNRVKIRDLQKRLYADQREGLIFIIVGMEASGKDRIIRKLVGALDPQGVSVERYSRPGKEDTKHDFFWRMHRKVPERGEIAILSGSYYEDILNYGVKGPERPVRVSSRIDWKNANDIHLQYVRNFEEYLYGSSYRVVKIFLNLSLKKQKKRLLRRLGDPEENWNLGPEVLDDRMQWFEYQKIFEKIAKATSTERSPWYVIPADRKWYANYLVSEVILRVMEEMNPQFPPAAASEGYSAYREALLSGKFDRKAILQRSRKKELAAETAEKLKNAEAAETAPETEDQRKVEPADAAEDLRETGSAEAVEDPGKTEPVEAVESASEMGESAGAPEAEAGEAEIEAPAAAEDLTHIPAAQEETTEEIAELESSEAEPAEVEPSAVETFEAEAEAPAVETSAAEAETPAVETPTAEASAAEIPAAKAPAAKKRASKPSVSAKKSSAKTEKEASGEAPKRRRTRKDGPPKTVEETLARRARRRGGAS